MLLNLTDQAGTGLSDMTRHGRPVAWRGMAGPGWAWHGMWLGQAGHGVAGQGWAWLGEAGRGWVRLDEAGRPREAKRG